VIFHFSDTAARTGLELAVGPRGHEPQRLPREAAPLGGESGAPGK